MPKPADVVAPAPNLDEQALSAFRSGVTDATENPEDAREREAATVEGDDVVEIIEDPNKETIEPEEKPEPVEKVVEKVEDKGAKEISDEAAAQAVEDEIKTLGIKNDKAAARFRELTSENKAFKEAGGIELLNQLKEAGVSHENIAGVIERAVFADQVAGMMESSGTTPEQFGLAMGYLDMVNSNDPVKLGYAMKALDAERDALAKRIGQKTHDYNPLEEFPDLKEKVESGRIDEEDALETARLRKNQKTLEDNRKKENEQGQEDQRFNDGINSLKMLAGELSGKDGVELYKRKFELLGPSLSAIQKAYPPEQWSEKVRELYGKLNIEAPKPVVKQENSLRPRGNRTSTLAPEITDEVSAFRAGVAAANQRR